MQKSVETPTNSGSADPAEIVLPHRTAPALMMSLVLHVVLLTTLGWILFTKPHGTGELEDRPIGIALVHRLPDRDQYVDPQQAESANPTEQESQSSQATSAAAPPADLAPPLDLAGVLKSMQSIPSPVSGSGLAGESELDGDAFRSSLDGKAASGTADTTTMLFGISGSGSSFVYVFDRSDSMNGFGGKPLRAAKTELIQSLKTLTDRQQFQIIFYNDQPKPFSMAGMPMQMVSGDESHVALAENYVRSILAFGATEHQSALKMALRMGPDVIFFLTDARIPRLSPTDLREIKHRADSVGTTIHCIEFGPEPVASADSFLRELAAQNHGEYRYVDVRGLGARPAASAPSDVGSTDFDNP